MHTPGGGEKRETLPFGFCVRKKKESLECFSLEDWRIARYTERERERKVCHSSRSINLDARKRDGEVYPDISTIEISNEHRT